MDKVSDKDQVNCQSNRQRKRQTQKQRDRERNYLLFLLFFSQYIVDNSRKIVRWSAVPVAPKLVYVRCGGEKGSNPEGANDPCWAHIEARIKDSRLGLEL